MAKILSQAGSSLADVYNVVGSIAGIDELDSRTVQLTHDMAATIFSERMASNIIGNNTGGVSQDSSIDAELVGLPDTPFRIHNVSVFQAGTTTIARLANMVLVMTNGAGDRDIIIWMWDGTVEIQRLEDDVKEVLMPEPGFAGNLPTIGMGGDQPSTVPQVFLKGDTTSFGAGTINIAARLHISFSQLEGISSVGLPIPSW